MSRLPCSFCLCSLATNIADIIFHYLYYTAEHQAEQWSRSLVRNITCTCFSVSAIHPMFENTGILALFVKIRRKILLNHPFVLTQFLNSFPKFILIEIHCLSFLQSKRKFHLRTKRTSMHFQ